MILTGNQDTEESQQDGSDHGEPGPLREQVYKILPYTSLSEWTLEVTYWFYISLCGFSVNDVELQLNYFLELGLISHFDSCQVFDLQLCPAIDFSMT